MKKILLIIALALSLSVTACSQVGTEEGKYEIKNINVYRKSNTVDKQIGIRFYSENPNVPYIGIKEYFNEFYNTQLTFNNDSSLCTFKKGDEAYIKLDTKNEVLWVKGLYDLSIHPDFHSNNEKTFLKQNKKTTTNKQYKLIDLNNYSIFTYSSKNDAYVPIALLGNMYGGIEGYNIGYNGSDIYVFDCYGSLTGEDRNDEYFADTYYNVLASKESRHEDLAKYNYNQLCLTFDNFRGHTTQLVFGDHNLLNMGLNSLLESFYPDIKKLLLSTSRSDYDKGIMLLFAGLFDGGHTALLSKNPPETSYYQSLKEDPKFKTLLEKVLAKDQARMKKRQTLLDTKTLTLGVDYITNPFGYYYNETYKTAYICFDKFVYDSTRWSQYYNGDKTKLEEMENASNVYDTYAFVRKSLYKAKEAGALTVVFDLTTNGGGDIEAVMGVLGLINGAKSYEVTNDVVDKTRTESNYTIDINLDGKYDDSDIEEAKKFNFKVVGLLSGFAFSNGNYLPSLMKENGFKLFGEKSGGGSCATLREITADGFFYMRSCYNSLTDKSGNNIDGGIDVDYSLVSYNTDGSIDTSKLYDAKVLSDYLK